jgi:hypothetical protein
MGCTQKMIRVFPEPMIHATPVVIVTTVRVIAAEIKASV